MDLEIDGVERPLQKHEDLWQKALPRKLLREEGKVDERGEVFQLGESSSTSGLELFTKGPFMKVKSSVLETL